MCTTLHHFACEWWFFLLMHGLSRQNGQEASQPNSTNTQTCTSKANVECVSNSQRQRERETGRERERERERERTSKMARARLGNTVQVLQETEFNGNCLDMFGPLKMTFGGACPFHYHLSRNHSRNHGIKKPTQNRGKNHKDSCRN